MALIGKIRKNFWFVLLLLGFALAAFVIMDMTGAGGQGGAVSNLTIGEVAGEKIDYRDFQQTESNYFRNTGTDVFSTRNSIWDFYVEKAVLNKEAEVLGLNVSRDELMDLQFGANPSPVIQQNWRNPQTGQLDVANLQQIKTTIETNQEMNPGFRAYWAEQEKQIIKERIQNKLNTIVSKGIFTPTWMAEEHFKADNDKVDFAFVKIPFDQIPGDDIEVTDADINSYLASKRSEYEVDEETRTIDYAEFEVLPTSEDTANILERANLLKDEFIRTNNDSLFTVNNSGVYTDIYFRADQISEVISEDFSSTPIGETYGPYIESGNYIVLKILDRKVIPDTVEARHILRSADPTNATQVEQAQAFIDSLDNLISRGVATFDSLAIKHSQDPGSGALGGDLGKFQQGRMVGPFNEVCFVTGQKRKRYSVKTQFGIHLIEIMDQIYNDREDKFKVASIGVPIVPSEETQDVIYDEVTELISENNTIEDLRTAIESMDGIQLKKSAPFKINDFRIDNLASGQTSREIIRWAFDPIVEPGDVSPDVFTYTDPVNFFNAKYVIASLNNIIPRGLPSADAVRSDVEVLVRNQKKGQIFIDQLSVTSLEAIAAANEVEVDTASEISFNTSFVPGLGNEPNVVSLAFDLDVQAISQPILGSSGVFIIQPLSRDAATEATNIPFIQRNVSNTTRSQVTFKLIRSLVDKAKIEDNRFTFF